MGRGRSADTRVGRLRRRGLRVSAGPWTAYGNTTTHSTGRLIVALGRRAGGATTRSRVRRIARDVFAGRFAAAARMDLLLLARNNVDALPRRQVRARLEELMVRLSGTLARRQADEEGNA